MKKIYMTMIALLCGAAAMAQGRITATPESLEGPQGGIAELTIGVADLPGAACALAFHMLMPEGCAFTTHTELVFNEETFEEEEVEFFDYVINSTYCQGHKASIQPVKENGEYTPGLFQVAVTQDDKKVFKGLAGDIVTLPVLIPETAAVGEYEIELRNVSASSSKGVSLAMDKEGIKVPFTIKEGTGINSINADDANAPIYNVAGQRVSKAQKGVFIQSGKKVAVK